VDDVDLSARLASASAFSLRTALLGSSTPPFRPEGVFVSERYPFHEDPFVCDLIQRKARQLASRSDFRGHDAVDVEQEFHLHLAHRGDRFDPQRGHVHAFVTGVIERHAASLVRKQQAKKRNPSRDTSLSKLVEGEFGPTELGHLIDARHQDEHLGRFPRPALEQAELRHDVDEVLATVSHQLRDLADRLSRDTPAQVARDRNVPRTSQNEEVRRLRGRFERQDLDQYF
jgi:hypothetical protein